MCRRSDIYCKVFVRANIPRYFLNSLVISFGATALALVLAVFASYGFARFNFKGKSLLQSFVLVGQLLPTAAIIVPLFITLRVLGLVNTYWGLILVYMIITLPLVGVDADQLFQGDPGRARGRAAIIDGARRRRLPCFASPCRCRCPVSSRCSSTPSSPP